nr:MAG TPA: hypothetical protein [Caudoviricetes sp.]
MILCKCRIKATTLLFYPVAVIRTTSIAFIRALLHAVTLRWQSALLSTESTRKNFRA